MPHRQRQAIIIATIVVVALLATGIIGLILNRQLNSPKNGTGQPVEFVISSQESVDSIANRLEASGLIRSTTYFKLRIQFSGKDQEIVAGTHKLDTAMSTAEIVSAITSESTVSYAETTITFLEGWRVEQYAEALLNAGLIDSIDQFLKATHEPRWNEEYAILHTRPSDAGLEGYLFPDTYTFRDDATAEDIIAKMLDNFTSKITPELRASAESLGLTFHQALVFASIVEREASVAEERPIIASVFINRYQAGMPLQADPTVQYQLGQSGDWWPVLDGSDLDAAGSYNTYLNPGIPPGPICNPGLASIQAAFAPAETDYLFFVATGEGTHVFATTYEEHQRNVEEYQQ